MDLTDAVKYRCEGVYWYDKFSRRLCGTCMLQHQESIPDLKPKQITHWNRFIECNYIINCDKCNQSLLRYTVHFVENEKMPLATFSEISRYVAANVEYFNKNK